MRVDLFYKIMTKKLEGSNKIKLNEMREQGLKGLFHFDKKQ